MSDRNEVIKKSVSLSVKAADIVNRVIEESDDELNFSEALSMIVCSSIGTNNDNVVQKEADDKTPSGGRDKSDNFQKKQDYSEIEGAISRSHERLVQLQSQVKIVVDKMSELDKEESVRGLISKEFEGIKDQLNRASRIREVPRPLEPKLCKSDSIVSEVRSGFSGQRSLLIIAIVLIAVQIIIGLI